MVLEYRVNWSVPSGGPGVTVLHGRPSDIVSDQDAAEELAQRAELLFTPLGPLLPVGVTISFPTTVDEYNTTTGVLEDTYVVEQNGDVAGSGAGDWAAPVGGRIEWRTASIVAGRRLRGRSFIVPLVASAFDTAGSLDSNAIGVLQFAADAYLDGGGLPDQVDPCVWSRTHGVLADISNATVPDQATILRSRRD